MIRITTSVVYFALLLLPSSGFSSFTVVTTVVSVFYPIYFRFNDFVQKIHLRTNVMFPMKRVTETIFENQINFW